MEDIICDLCKQPAKDVYIDGKTKFGYWANMCASCFMERGVGLGSGKGQKYNVRTGTKLAG